MRDETFEGDGRLQNAGKQIRDINLHLVQLQSRPMSCDRWQRARSCKSCQIINSVYHCIQAYQAHRPNEDPANVHASL